ncbi:unnamed protein product [Peniophora sp. CBMAI 1063]|nr:unnamed protein product [Peniophora sp. CBMAI 1063]
MSWASGPSACRGPPLGRDELDSAHLVPQLRALAGHRYTPYRPKQDFAPAFAAQEAAHCTPGAVYTQTRHDADLVVPYGVPRPVAQGSAGYRYRNMNPAPMSVALTAGSPPLPPHNTETRQSGQSSAASNDGPYPSGVGYTQDHPSYRTHYRDVHGHYAPRLEHNPPTSQPFPLSDDWWLPSSMPPIPDAARSQFSSLANALGDVMLKLSSPASAGPTTRALSPPSVDTGTPSLQSVRPTPPFPATEVLSTTPVEIEYGEQDVTPGVHFSHETTPPISMTPGTFCHARPGDSPAELTCAPRPPSAGPATPLVQSVRPTLLLPATKALSIAPVEIRDDEQDAVQNVTFIHETGSPDLMTPSTSSCAKAGDSPTEDEPPRRRRKRTRGPNKGPRKGRGFLACFFCRGRKISCNPVLGSGEKTCE